MGLWFVSVAAATEVCASFGDAGDSIVVEDIPAVESSGVAHRGDGVYFTHDDEEGDAALHAFTLDGEYLGAQAVTNASNVDWEDLAVGPCPATVDAADCVWIGDVGDNDEVRDEIVVYVVPLSSEASETAVACALRYPEGKRHDAETVLVDPDGVLRVVTKEGDGEAHVFRVDAPRCDGDADTLEEEAELALGSPVTGGAMRADGLAVVLVSESEAWLWTGCVNWAREPVEIELGSQQQREAVTFAPDGSLVITSEGDPFRVWSAPCADTKEAKCPACGCGGGDGAWLLLPLAWLRRRR
ncbi:MAG: hypothetical protein ACOZNI_29655 [Myxococcota bacterium]